MSQKPSCLTASHNKYCVFPVSNKAAWTFYKLLEASMWSAQEIDFSKDLQDWKKMNNDEQFFIKRTLAFFASSDGIVNENLVENFYQEVECSSCKQFYAAQIFQEAVHSETYSLLINEYVTDKTEKAMLFNAVEHFPSVQRKAEWCFKYTNRDRATFVERLIAFAVCEGIFFSGSFCAIFFMKKRNLLPGLCFSNELISRDEGQHRDFAVMLYRQCVEEGFGLSDEKVYTIVREAVDIELEYVSESLPVDLIGMNKRDMKLYVKFVSDHLLRALSHSTLYNVENPFHWMELVSLSSKSNMFERRVSEYQKANVGVCSDIKNNTFEFTTGESF